MTFFDPFDSFFEFLFKPVYNRPFKEIDSLKLYGVDDGYLVVANTLGVSKDDLEVEITKEQGNPYPVLKISGSTKIEKVGIENNVKYRASLKLPEEIKNISYNVKDGFTYVFIEVNKEKPEEFKVSYNDDANW